MPDDRPVTCQNCGWNGTVRQCEPIAARHLAERVPAGDVMPAGDCPECGASAMLDRPDTGPAVAIVTVTSPERASHFGVRSTAQSLANVMWALRNNRDYPIQDMGPAGFRVSVKKYSPYNRMIADGYLRIENLQDQA